MTARYIVADVFDGIASLDDASVDLVLTSPPFLALRSYLPADHPDKAKEIGSEPTPEAFIDTLLDVVEAVTPKLAPHGSICIELGDTYSGSNPGSGAGSDTTDRWYSRGAGGKQRMGRHVARAGDGWPLDKSLCLIPESFRWALVYGYNPFNGRTTPRWRARNVIRWCRPNPPVGALGDKMRPATSEMVVLCKSDRRYFDLDAVREAHKSDPARYTGNGYTKGAPEGVPGHEAMPGNPAGAPPLDWWCIPTEPYAGSHYATWPRDLLVRPVKAMCPQRVCRTCGEPSRRIVEKSPEYAALRAADPRSDWGDDEHGEHVVLPSGPSGFCASYSTVGWTDCGCSTDRSHWRTGCVLDPFAGSGTTLAVATGHGRDAIGIDLDGRNADLAMARVGPLFFEVEHLSGTVHR